MITHAFGWLSIPIALFIGGIGAVSVFKAVYIDKRDIKCACVGGNSNVPLGFVSLTENVRSEEHTSELQSLMRISYAVFCLKKKKNINILHKQDPIILIVNNIYRMNNNYKYQHMVH